jgi:hypothetical protein
MLLIVVGDQKRIASPDLVVELKAMQEKIEKIDKDARYLQEPCPEERTAKEEVPLTTQLNVKMRRKR